MNFIQTLIYIKTFKNSYIRKYEIDSTLRDGI